MIEQRSPEWFAQRLGKVTASRINDVLARLKSGGEAATRKNYRTQLALERLTGKRESAFTNSAMQWGTDCEPLALAAYEAETGQFVAPAEFVPHSRLPETGASPDGLVGTDGLIEIKCPNSATHFDWLLAGAVPLEHQNQMQWQMACTGRAWCDFVSYDPRMPEYAQLFIKRLARDDARISDMEAHIAEFCCEVQTLCEQIESLKTR